MDLLEDVSGDNNEWLHRPYILIKLCLDEKHTLHLLHSDDFDCDGLCIYHNDIAVVSPWTRDATDETTRKYRFERFNQIMKNQFGSKYHWDGTKERAMFLEL